MAILSSGNADATMQIEPLITKGVSEGILEWWKDPDEYAKGEEISVVMYSPEFAKKKDLGNRFMLGYLQGVRAYNDALVNGDKDQDKIVDILTKTTFVDTPEIFLQMKPPGLDPNGYVLREGVIADQQWYIKQGLVKEKADIDKLIDNSYVDEALKVLKEYQK